MKQALDTRTKLLTKNPWPLMIELSIPAVLGMVVVGLYNMMDSIFVGQMVGDVQMGAISVSYPLTLINAGSAAMLGVGSASVLSRAIGKKDENTIKKIMGNLVAMVLLLSVIYTVVGMVFTRQLLSLTGASDNILNYAEKYLRIVFAGSLFVNFFQSANMVIRGEGQLKRAMTIIASGAILNIILDPIFISILNPYGMGIEAAAYATIFSQFVQVEIVRDIHKRLISNLQERPTIEELSKEYLINTATLKDTFKGVYGQPIGTYMKVYRMKQAAALLRQTQATIAEIASQVGYENQSKFATAFRDVMKIAPAEYRKQNSGD